MHRFKLVYVSAFLFSLGLAATMQAADIDPPLPVLYLPGFVTASTTIEAVTNPVGKKLWLLGRPLHEYWNPPGLGLSSTMVPIEPKYLFIQDIGSTPSTS